MTTWPYSKWSFTKTYIPEYLYMYSQAYIFPSAGSFLQCSGHGAWPNGLQSYRRAMPQDVKRLVVLWTTHGRNAINHSLVAHQNRSTNLLYHSRIWEAEIEIMPGRESEKMHLALRLSLCTHSQFVFFSVLDTNEVGSLSFPLSDAENDNILAVSKQSCDFIFPYFFDHTWQNSGVTPGSA